MVMKKKNILFDTIKKDKRVYRHIFNNMVDVLYRADNDGIITLISPSAASMFGYKSVNELIGKKISETLYFNPSDRKIFLEKLASKKKLVNYPLKLKKKDGTMFHGKTSS